MAVVGLLCVHLVLHYLHSVTVASVDNERGAPTPVLASPTTPRWIQQHQQSHPLHSSIADVAGRGEGENVQVEEEEEEEEEKKKNKGGERRWEAVEQQQQQQQPMTTTPPSVLIQWMTQPTPLPIAVTLTAAATATSTTTTTTTTTTTSTTSTAAAAATTTTPTTDSSPNSFIHHHTQYPVSMHSHTPTSFIPSSSSTENRDLPTSFIGTHDPSIYPHVSYYYPAASVQSPSSVRGLSISPPVSTLPPSVTFTYPQTSSPTVRVSGKSPIGVLYSSTLNETPTRSPASPVYTQGSSVSLSVPKDSPNYTLTISSVLHGPKNSPNCTLSNSSFPPSPKKSPSRPSPTRNIPITTHQTSTYSVTATTTTTKNIRRRRFRRFAFQSSTVPSTTLRTQASHISSTSKGPVPPTVTSISPRQSIISSTETRTTKVTTKGDYRLRETEDVILGTGENAQEMDEKKLRDGSGTNMTSTLHHQLKNRSSSLLQSGQVKATRDTEEIEESSGHNGSSTDLSLGDSGTIRSSTTFSQKYLISSTPTPERIPTERSRQEHAQIRQQYLTPTTHQDEGTLSASDTQETASVHQYMPPKTNTSQLVTDRGVRERDKVPHNDLLHNETLDIGGQEDTRKKGRVSHILLSGATTPIDMLKSNEQVTRENPLSSFLGGEDEAEKTTTTVKYFISSTQYPGGRVSGDEYNMTDTILLKNLHDDDALNRGGRRETDEKSPPRVSQSEDVVSKDADGKNKEETEGATDNKPYRNNHGEVLNERTIDERNRDEGGRERQDATERDPLRDYHETPLLPLGARQSDWAQLARIWSAGDGDQWMGGGRGPPWEWTKGRRRRRKLRGFVAVHKAQPPIHLLSNPFLPTPPTAVHIPITPSPATRFITTPSHGRQVPVTPSTTTHLTATHITPTPYLSTLVQPQTMNSGTSSETLHVGGKRIISSRTLVPAGESEVYKQSPNLDIDNRSAVTHGKRIGEGPLDTSKGTLQTRKHDTSSSRPPTMDILAERFEGRRGPIDFEVTKTGDYSGFSVTKTEEVDVPPVQDFSITRRNGDPNPGLRILQGNRTSKVKAVKEGVKFGPEGQRQETSKSSRILEDTLDRSPKRISDAIRRGEWRERRDGGKREWRETSREEEKWRKEETKTRKRQWLNTGDGEINNKMDGETRRDWGENTEWRETHGENREKRNKETRENIDTQSSQGHGTSKGTPEISGAGDRRIIPPHRSKGQSTTSTKSSISSSTYSSSSSSSSSSSTQFSSPNQSQEYSHVHKLKLDLSANSDETASTENNNLNPDNSISIQTQRLNRSMTPAQVRSENRVRSVNSTSRPLEGGVGSSNSSSSSTHVDSLSASERMYSQELRRAKLMSIPATTTATITTTQTSSGGEDTKLDSNSSSSRSSSSTLSSMFSEDLIPPLPYSWDVWRVKGKQRGSRDDGKAAEVNNARENHGGKTLEMADDGSDDNTLSANDDSATVFSSRRLSKGMGIGDGNDDDGDRDSDDDGDSDGGDGVGEGEETIQDFNRSQNTIDGDPHRQRSRSNIKEKSVNAKRNVSATIHEAAAAKLKHEDKTQDNNNNNNNNNNRDVAMNRGDEEGLTNHAKMNDKNGSTTHNNDRKTSSHESDNSASGEPVHQAVSPSSTTSEQNKPNSHIDVRRKIQDERTLHQHIKPTTETTTWPGPGERVEFITVVPGGNWDVWGGPVLWDSLSPNSSLRGPQVYSVYWGDTGGPGSPPGWPEGVWVLRGGSLVAIMALVVTISVQVARGDGPSSQKSGSAATGGTSSDVLLRAHQSQHATLATNLATSLASAHVLFIFGIQATGRGWVCGVVGLLLHFLHLVTCCWLLCLTMRLLASLLRRPPLHTALYCLPAWAASLALVVVSFVVNPGGYESRRYCWMSVERGMLVSFIVPVCTLILVNAGVCIAIQKLLLELPEGATAVQRRELRGAVSLLPLQGVAWFLAVVALEDNQSIALDFAAAFVSAVMGVLVLYFHGWWLWRCDGLCWLRRRLASRRLDDLSLPLTTASSRFDHDLVNQPLLSRPPQTTNTTPTSSSSTNNTSTTSNNNNAAVTVGPPATPSSSSALLQQPQQLHQPPLQPQSHHHQQTQQQQQQQQPQQSLRSQIQASRSEEFPLQPIFPIHERREVY